jgi:hypothetical protein
MDGVIGLNPQHQFLSRGNHIDTLPRSSQHSPVLSDLRPVRDPALSQVQCRVAGNVGSVINNIGDICDSRSSGVELCAIAGSAWNDPARNGTCVRDVKSLAVGREHNAIWLLDDDSRPCVGIEAIRRRW